VVGHSRRQEVLKREVQGDPRAQGETDPVAAVRRVPGTRPALRVHLDALLRLETPLHVLQERLHLEDVEGGTDRRQDLRLVPDRGPGGPGSRPGPELRCDPQRGRVRSTAE